MSYTSEFNKLGAAMLGAAKIIGEAPKEEEKKEEVKEAPVDDKFKDVKTLDEIAADPSITHISGKEYLAAIEKERAMSGANKSLEKMQIALTTEQQEVEARKRIRSNFETQKGKVGIK